MGAVAVGFGMRISTSTHEIRGAGVVSGLSEIWRLHGADGPFDAGRVLGLDFAAKRPSRFFLEIEIAERPPVGVTHDEAGGLPHRRTTAAKQRGRQNVEFCCCVDS